jgi:hypothetical protein
MPRLSLPPAAAPAPGAAPMPTPAELAALGTVLCLSRADGGGETGGWLRACRVEVAVALDSDGMRESLRFHDAAGACCWQLFLLPDSDFLAWERLARRLPRHADAGGGAGLAERMLARLAGRAREGDWLASVLRLQAHPGRPAPRLVARLAAVSPLGAAAARVIARTQHADAEALRDDCCCLGGARAASRLAAAAGGDHAFPLRVGLSRPDRH